MRSPPLAGLRVLDLTRLLPGPMATMHLADLGADVIKIEDTGPGDYARDAGAVHGSISYFQLVNRNKRSLRLDLKQAAGVDAFMRLASTADVILEGFRPGVVDKLGIGYAAVSAVNPRIVYCAITGYGQDGPYRDRAGHDLNYLACCGLLDQIGTAGQAPAIPNFQIGDLLGGSLTALVGILAGVVDARQSGRGRYVDVAMTDAVFAHTIFPLLAVLGLGQVLPRGTDLLSGGIPSYGVYATGDGRHLAVSAMEPKFWQTLCSVLGRPELRPFAFATGDEGRRVRRELEAAFAGRSLAEWTALFDEADCCVSPVLRFEESLANEHLLARQMIVEVDGVRQFAPPFRISELSFAARLPPPGAGEHSEEVLRESGFSESEIKSLRTAGVI
ncbi:CaiB/BaiF CoA-transferase family protein [Accumulibacter sp.]|uniref:CaiB/BaiF CoA transferase family protein n=1 Tax=Accumulibacter sp. TaxID=2053492 RepID=UPI0025F31AAE|nr:CaiB/BaiF CoA-transferase family protein [Accumulibacter sp.]MCM8596337.1 CoA transferase [Accumulibacter sp.]MCM8627471.1 CoA transferase [Accumulibacter sp.]MDS4050486.1 CaiB/BaiF CoA-transferase family protein [Accumulibacter sp.]